MIHCGDTVWHGSWWKLGMQYGPFDAAFLPINGALVGWPVPPSGIPASLTPEQAAAAAQILGARLACANHYGWNSPPGYVEFPNCEKAFLEAARGRGVNAVAVRPGDLVLLPERR